MADFCPDGKLYLDETGHLPIDPNASDHDPEQELAAVNGNWWIGLSTLHTLFTREHNSIVDRLHIEYPDKDGEWLFQKARLINAAMIAKYMPPNGRQPYCRHRPCNTPCAAAGGAYSGRPISRRSDVRATTSFSPAFPHLRKEHYAAPYSITEEFTAVYRLHSLIPDDFSFRQHRDDKELLSCTFRT